MSTIREVKYKEEASGIFGFNCANCPLLPDAEMFGVLAVNCAHGIATRMSGPLILNTCENLEPNSWDSINDKLTIRCNFKKKRGRTDRKSLPRRVTHHREERRSKP